MSKLPQFFRPILWSYDAAKINLQKDSKTIITQTINYGDLVHWRWITRFYGRKRIESVLGQIPSTEIRESARRLASILLGVKKFDDAPRGTGITR